MVLTKVARTKNQKYTCQSSHNNKNRKPNGLYPYPKRSQQRYLEKLLIKTLNIIENKLQHTREQKQFKHKEPTLKILIEAVHIESQEHTSKPSHNYKNIKHNRLYPYPKNNQHRKLQKSPIKPPNMIKKCSAQLQHTRARTETI